MRDKAVAPEKTALPPTAEVKAAVSLLKREARLLGKFARKRGAQGVSSHTLLLIDELVSSIRIDRKALKRTEARLSEPKALWPFPQSIAP